MPLIPGAGSGVTLRSSRNQPYEKEIMAHDTDPAPDPWECTISELGELVDTRPSDLDEAPLPGTSTCL